VKRKVIIFSILAFVLVISAISLRFVTRQIESPESQEQIQALVHEIEQENEQGEQNEQGQEEQDEQENENETYETIPEPTVLFRTSFENDFDGFEPRGNVSMVRTQDESRTGSYSVFVSERQQAWNGIRLDITDLATPLEDHAFSFWVKPVDEVVSFNVAVEFILRGETRFRHMWDMDTAETTSAVIQAQPNEWTEFRAYRPFYDFDRVYLSIQTAYDTHANASFFVDDVTFRNTMPEFIFMDDLPRLHEVFADYFLIGTAVIPRDLRNSTRYDFIFHHFNAMTAGNEMKPDALQPRAGQFYWYVADDMVQTAMENDITMIGHTLVWHSQSPAWMNPSGISRDEAIENLVNHVTEVVTRYAGQVAVWDVVNEAFPSSVLPSPAGEPVDWRSQLRQTPWLEAIGYDYIEIAFRAAHAADPTAKLIYNDYNLNQPGKREAVFYMVKELLERGVPIHGIGMQGHYSLDTNPRQVEASILRFAELGINVSITELDITVPNSTGQEQLTNLQERQQAVLYARLFLIFKEHHEVIDRVTFWGLDDATSWRAERFPLLFNYDLTPKLSFFAILDPENFIIEQGLRP
jgi:endo-1,4-beta-xylanase